MFGSVSAILVAAALPATRDSAGRWCELGELKRTCKGTQGFYAEVACEVLWRLLRLAFAGHWPMVAFLSFGLGPLSGDES